MQAITLFSIREIESNFYFDDECEKILRTDVFELTVNDLINLTQKSKKFLTSPELLSEILKRTFNYEEDKTKDLIGIQEPKVIKILQDLKRQLR